MRKALRRLPVLPALLLLGILAAVPAAAENMDLVVVVDTSESMFPYFDDLMNSLVQDLLTEKLHRGDSFHLLSFSSAPEVEIALEVNTQEAAERAFGRLLLLHPLGRYTDLVEALRFVHTYVRELPETNPKRVLLLTDGVHDPPPGSAHRGSPEAVGKAVQEAAAAIRAEGWSVSIMKVPPEPAKGDAGLKSYLGELAQVLGVQVSSFRNGSGVNLTGLALGFPSLSFPANLGKVGNRFVAPFKVKNNDGQNPILLGLVSVQSEGTELLEKKVQLTVPPGDEAVLEVPIRLPLSFPRGDHAREIQLVFQDDLRISPTRGALTFTYTGKGGLPIPRLTFLYILYILLAAAVIYLLVRLFLFMREKMHEVSLSGFSQAAGSRASSPGQASPARTGAASRGRRLIPLMQAAAPSGGAPASGREKAASAGTPAARRRARPTATSIRRALPGPRLQQAALPPQIEMRVSQQNSHVGFRNVHRIPTGTTRTVGGGFSSYLVFLVPVPGGIGEIANQDGTYVFTPRRPEFFPGLAGPVSGCLEKEIPFTTAKGKELTLSFRKWISPLEEINRLMRSVSHEG